LIYLRDGDRLFVTGSNFGQRNHPTWTSNLTADPDAWVTIGGKEISVRAQQLVHPEASQIYDRFVDYAANYGAYQNRAHRTIRVFALTERPPGPVEPG
jgi:deazaflavin-dependent oxidoreductase (nitroreductase family)